MKIKNNLQSWFFTGYDESKINRSIYIILKNITKFDISVQKEPFSEKYPNRIYQRYGGWTALKQKKINHN